MIALSFLDRAALPAICKNNFRKETVLPDPGSPTTRKAREEELSIALVRLG